MNILMFGRYINEKDVINKEKNVVIGRLVKQDLFGDGEAVGKYINGGGRSWKVIGVFQDDGGDNEERIVYVPYTTLQLIQKNTDKTFCVLKHKKTITQKITRNCILFEKLGLRKIQILLLTYL